jgi:SAM-dependent methyltransferase
MSDSDDPYTSGIYRWWHLSEPSPELLAALQSGFLGRRSFVLDIGSGLGTEAAYLARCGYHAVGIDLLKSATVGARELHRDVPFLRADVQSLPFRASSFDSAIDRGCFHYLPARARSRYANELERVLRPAGSFLLRACLRAEGVRNDINPSVIRNIFRRWTVESIVETSIPSDTRQMDALIVRLRRE